MTKLISFSLWGADPKYNVGIIRNAYLKEHIYPGFRMRVYYDYTVPKETLYQLDALNCELIDMTEDKYNQAKLFWRFYPLDEPDIEFLLVRDADSRLNLRDRHVFDYWLGLFDNRIEQPCFNSIQDHPYHHNPIMGCYLNAYKPYLGNTRFKSSLRNWPSLSVYGDDEEFLKSIILPKIKDYSHILKYKEILNILPYENFRFIGEVFDTEEQCNPEHRYILINDLSR